jgi:hypothetical protein
MVVWIEEQLALDYSNPNLCFALMYLVVGVVERIIYDPMQLKRDGQQGIGGRVRVEP